MTATPMISQALPAPPSMAPMRSVPPRVVIPSDSVAAASRASSSSGKSTSSKSGKAAIAASEKVGRWTEEEHLAFLDGLEKHGKQWKTIATMIGTRTVVQVRTHAQKYFQKMERKNKPVQMGSLTEPSPPAPVAPKRKSLPASLPSRKKLKTTPTKGKPRISISLSSLSPSPPPTEVITSLPIFSSSSSENLSTISPAGVTELYSDACGSSFAEPTDMDSFHLDEFEGAPIGTGEDPLEWLMDNDDHTMNVLPESSLTAAGPLFPDFTAEALPDSIVQLQPQALQPQPQLHNPLLGNVIGTDVIDSLPNLADPKVTVQSLFLGDE